MAEHGCRRQARRETARRQDFVALIGGLITLGIAAFILTGGNLWVPEVDGRWLVAGGAGLVGLVLLGTTLNRRR